MKKEENAPAPSRRDINVTPMVDVMLVMLIIFMVITPMLSKGVSVDMVQDEEPHRDAGRRQGRRGAGGGDARRQGVPGDHADAARTLLPAKVKDMLTNRLDKTCYLKADSRARYEKVVEVVDNFAPPAWTTRPADRGASQKKADRRDSGSRSAATPAPVAVGANRWSSASAERTNRIKENLCQWQLVARWA